jgi:hypothetical protein
MTVVRDRPRCPCGAWLRRVVIDDEDLVVLACETCELRWAQRAPASTPTPPVHEGELARLTTEVARLTDGAPLHLVVEGDTTLALPSSSAGRPALLADQVLSRAVDPLATLRRWREAGHQVVIVRELNHAGASAELLGSHWALGRGARWRFTPRALAHHLGALFPRVTVFTFGLRPIRRRDGRSVVPGWARPLAVRLAEQTARGDLLYAVAST